AEDGIRGGHVTGVQTCALPISQRLPVAVAQRLLEAALVELPVEKLVLRLPALAQQGGDHRDAVQSARGLGPGQFRRGRQEVPEEIGRASWRQREKYEVATE